MSTESRRAPSGDGLFILALIGRAGSGKSTVARALSADGAERIDADRLGHRVTDLDPEVRAALIEEYGPGVYFADGTLDRAAVAAKVFRDRAARARLDALTHPRIVRMIRDRLAALRERGFRGLVVLDAALILDWALERECDAVLAVAAPEDLLIERLMLSRGWSWADANARLAAQRSQQDFRDHADVTLDNTGTEDELVRDARAALAQLMESRGFRL
jgi:dephospho-CoA kinase